MNVLALDFGTSSLKAAMLRGTKIIGKIVRVPMIGGAEIEAESFLRAMRLAIARLPKTAVKRADYLAMSVMSPSWVAMDKNGRAITPVITHQDRRSLKEAIEIERRVGREHHLKITGNRPIPGGISSTTFAWFNRHDRQRMKKADLVGHLNTFLHRQLTGARVVDPGNASFIGLVSVRSGEWCEELIEVVGAKRQQLPEIRHGNEIAGRLTREAAKAFGLSEGLPVLTGLIDTSAAMLLTGARTGQMLNVCGSTDVLAVCMDRPKPDVRYLTRALGVDGKWLAVSTIAAAGSALEWARKTFYPELSEKTFYERLKNSPATNVACEPWLAGSRHTIEQPTGAFSNVTLQTTRDDLLRALIDALRMQSAARLPLLMRTVGAKVPREVIVTGGASSILHSDWPGKWRFRFEGDATLRGLGAMEVRE